LNNITNARRLREGEIIKIPNMDGIPYNVKAGDTLTQISKEMGVPVEAVLDANDLDNDKISAGMMLFIPGARMAKDELKLAMGELFIYPLKGRLTSPFGWRNDPISGVRRYHAAMDIAVPIGTPVKAAMDGKVASTGTNATYGKYVIMSHGGSYQTMYAHLSSILVKQGASVNQGAKIAESGNTGYSTGPHLHFAVYKNNRAINPLDVLAP
jgi:murein DD-endopeptidase MepM/ murein hydrolase activator NlpD